MATKPTNEWELVKKSELVSIGSHYLYVSTSGPPRKSHEPVVVFITGGGASTEMYVHFQPEVSKFARCYFYDRTGYGRSERPPTDESDGPTESTQKDTSTSADSSNDDGKNKIYAEDSAKELHDLLQAINVEPPYILVAHSYGGVIARTYYHLFPTDVAGLALLDANTELFQQAIMLSQQATEAYQHVVANVDFDKIRHLREDSGMTDEEWEAAQAAIRKTAPASAAEDTHESGRQLARYKQIDHQALGDKPLIVVTSNITAQWREIFDEGVRLGGGTEEERKTAAWWVESGELFYRQIQRVQLELSRNVEYNHFGDLGHEFPITAPARTAGVVKRVLDMVREQRGAVGD